MTGTSSVNDRLVPKGHLLPKCISNYSSSLLATLYTDTKGTPWESGVQQHNGGQTGSRKAYGEDAVKLEENN